MNNIRYKIPRFPIFLDLHNHIENNIYYTNIYEIGDDVITKIGLDVENVVAGYYSFDYLNVSSQVLKTIQSQIKQQVYE